MAKIVIDGKEYEVDPNNNLLQECLSQGLDLLDVTVKSEKHWKG